eukprot:3453654-Rhodomonas_salina.2
MPRRCAFRPTCDGNRIQPCLADSELLLALPPAPDFSFCVEQRERESILTERETAGLAHREAFTLHASLSLRTDRLSQAANSIFASAIPSFLSLLLSSIADASYPAHLYSCLVSLKCTSPLHAHSASPPGHSVWLHYVQVLGPRTCTAQDLAPCRIGDTAGVERTDWSAATILSSCWKRKAAVVFCGGTAKKSGSSGFVNKGSRVQCLDSVKYLLSVGTFLCARVRRWTGKKASETERWQEENNRFCIV